MTQSSRKLLLCCLVMSVVPACGVDIEREAEAQPASTETAQSLGRQNLSPSGEVIGLNQAPLPPPPAANATACFQLNNGAQTWFVNAVLDINAYPYTIVGGGISGTICDSPNWALTGGTVGPGLTINGTHTGAGLCAATVSIVGPFGPPSGYAGTYGFNGVSNTFPHRTLFLGFNRACP